MLDIFRKELDGGVLEWPRPGTRKKSERCSRSFTLQAPEYISPSTIARESSAPSSPKSSAGAVSPSPQGKSGHLLASHSSMICHSSISAVRSRPTTSTCSLIPSVLWISARTTGSSIFPWCRLTRIFVTDLEFAFRLPIDWHGRKCTPDGDHTQHNDGWYVAVARRGTVRQNQPKLRCKPD